MSAPFTDYPWLAAALVAVIGFAAVKLFWGAALWTKGVQHRVGARWGEEPIEVKEWSGGEGYVDAGGELWRAVSKDKLIAGERVIVKKMRGLTLEVRRAGEG